MATNRFCMELNGQADVLMGKYRREVDCEKHHQHSNPLIAILKRFGVSTASLESAEQSTEASTTNSSETRHSEGRLPRPLPSTPVLEAHPEFTRPPLSSRQHSRLTAWDDLKSFADIGAPWITADPAQKVSGKPKSQRRSKDSPQVELPTFPATKSSLAPFTKVTAYGECLLSSAGNWTAYTLLLTMSIDTPLDHAAEAHQNVAYLHLLAESDSPEPSNQWEPVLVEIERRALGRNTVLSADLSVDPVILFKFHDLRKSPAWSLLIFRQGQRREFLLHMQAMILLMNTEHSLRQKAARSRFQLYPTKVRQLAEMPNAPHRISGKSSDVSSEGSSHDSDRFYIPSPNQHPSRFGHALTKPRTVDDRFNMLATGSWVFEEGAFTQPQTHRPGRSQLQLHIPTPNILPPQNFAERRCPEMDPARRNHSPVQGRRFAMREISDNLPSPPRTPTRCRQPVESRSIARPTSSPMRREVDRRHRRDGVVGLPSPGKRPLDGLPTRVNPIVTAGPSTPLHALFHPSLPAHEAVEDLEEILEPSGSLSARESSTSELLRGLAIPRPPRQFRTTYVPCWRRMLTSSAHCQFHLSISTEFSFLHDMFHVIDAFLRDHTARTPLVLGTSLPPVRVMAMRMARARALKAASALAMLETDPQLKNKTHMW